MKIKIQIKSVSGKLLFELEKEDNTIAHTLTEAIKSNADLHGAILQGADLQGADLQGADLQGAILQGANLRGAILYGAILQGATLRGADLNGAILQGANLCGADLHGAILEGANLRGTHLHGAILEGANLRGTHLRGAILKGANLRGTDLHGAILKGANLREAVLHGAILDGAVLDGAVLDGADLLPFKADLFEILLHAIPEVEGLKNALLSGKINGSVYEGECACLVGTIANLRSCNYKHLPGIRANSQRPAEQFFATIKPGHTPESNPFVAIALEWINEFQSLVNLIQLIQKS